MSGHLRGTSSSLYRLVSAGIALQSQSVQRFWVGHLMVSMGGLAARVLGQAQLVPGSADGQA